MKIGLMETAFVSLGMVKMQQESVVGFVDLWNNGLEDAHAKKTVVESKEDVSSVHKTHMY